VKLVVSQAAAADLVRLRAFLLERNPQAAQRAVAAIVRAVDSLDVFPERGRPAPVAGMRELVVPFGGSAYVVRFAIEFYLQLCRFQLVDDVVERDYDIFESQHITVQ
jgi:plasmid stabilization system protein ParE